MTAPASWSGDVEVVRDAFNGRNPEGGYEALARLTERLEAAERERKNAEDRANASDLIRGKWETRSVSAEQRVEELREALRRAVSIAEHLFQMIDPQTWRESGADDGQGHYEGDYRAEQIREQLDALSASDSGEA